MLRKFEVTKDHIARGMPEDPICCPVALCMVEALNTFVSIKSSFATVSVLGRKCCLVLPDAVKKFIESFDNVICDEDGYEIDDRLSYVSPFQFEMDIPTE